MRYDAFHPGQVWLDTEKTEMYEKYLDPTLSAEERADDLLAKNEFGRKNLRRHSVDLRSGFWKTERIRMGWGRFPVCLRA